MKCTFVFVYRDSESLNGMDIVRNEIRVCARLSDFETLLRA